MEVLRMLTSSGGAARGSSDGGNVAEILNFVGVIILVVVVIAFLVIGVIVMTKKYGGVSEAITALFRRPDPVEKKTDEDDLSETVDDEDHDDWFD